MAHGQGVCGVMLTDLSVPAAVTLDILVCVYSICVLEVLQKCSRSCEFLCSGLGLVDGGEISNLLQKSKVEFPGSTGAYAGV